MWSLIIFNRNHINRKNNNDNSEDSNSYNNNNNNNNNDNNNNNNVAFLNYICRILGLIIFDCLL